MFSVHVFLFPFKTEEFAARHFSQHRAFFWKHQINSCRFPPTSSPPLPAPALTDLSLQGFLHCYCLHQRRAPSLALLPNTLAASVLTSFATSSSQHSPDVGATRYIIHTTHAANSSWCAKQMAGCEHKRAAINQTPAWPAWCLMQTQRDGWA